ncbi:hypothetical protein QVD17_00606 [Tagetes erecta]|uniref:Uncharacterized protein n=1 Tax=Tagetes erecta TaxID=13708 RepID=A0AAD8P7C8_TARER|nr:hypothetical protein QVD17_00606 [Tagetes erecta]
MAVESRGGSVELLSAHGTTLNAHLTIFHPISFTPFSHTDPPPPTILQHHLLPLHFASHTLSLSPKSYFY